MHKGLNQRPLDWRKLGRALLWRHKPSHEAEKTKKNLNNLHISISQSQGIINYYLIIINNFTIQRNGTMQVISIVFFVYPASCDVNEAIPCAEVFSLIYGALIKLLVANMLYDFLCVWHICMVTLLHNYVTWI